MKIHAIVWSLCLVTSFTALCQTTSADTLIAFNPEQLRTAALIFTEHRFLKEENRLLESRCATLQTKVEAGEKMMAGYRDALAKLERNRQEADRARETINENLRTQLKQQQRKTRRRTIGGIAAGVAVGVVIGMTVK